jgi:diguanylate cyclase (GGDEF)-like protein/putative nucleotidyltransferase with HDIG domain
MQVSAMEAKHATDCAPWKEGIDPVAARSIAGAIDDLAEFPVLDATVLRIIALCDDQDSTAADLVDALEQDATFAANLLRFANSAARAHPIRAKTIRQAVMLVGRRALRRLALEAATFRFLERSRGNGRASCGQLHLHAITVAVGAAAAAEEARQPGDTVHLAGLLHDVGKLVLPEVFGEQACDDLAREFPAGAERVLAERERFGIDHAQCGALLAERWGLPAEVASIIAWHHGGPTGVGAPNADVACVQLADNVAGMLHGTEADHALLEVALDRLGLTSDVLDVLADQIANPDQRTTDGGRLAQRVAELERLSQTDDLTGLANRRHWLQTTRTALIENGGGAILICDIDHFKAVNERHGMAAGDLVLAEIGRILAVHGHAGRLGGDEFAVLVPGNLEEAVQAAQRIMAQVSEVFEAGSGPKIDLSLGCAAAPTHGDELADLLEAADVALLDAKRAGRSRAMIAGAELRTDGLAA